MPTLRVPLVGVNSQRSIDAGASIAAGLDQEFVNCTFDLIKNPITGKSTIFCEKRGGWTQESLVAAGSKGTGGIQSDTTGTTISAFGSTNSTIYDGQTTCGAITGTAQHFSETIINSIGYVLIKSSDGTGWYYASNAQTSLTFTGTTHTNTTIDGIADTTGLHSGQAISGTGIQAGTRILSVDSAVAITTTIATTASASITITKTPIAKILDADFVTSGAYISALVPMDGYLFYNNQDAYVRGSDLNSVISYSATNAIAANIAPDPGVALVRYKNRLLAFQTNSMEVFADAGNPSGSPLNSEPTLFKRLGCQDQRSVCQLADDIYFVSGSKDGDTSVYRMRDFGATRVSTPVIDKILGTASASGCNIYLSGFQLGGYQYVAAVGTQSSGFLLTESGGILLAENGDQILLEQDEDSDTAYAFELYYNVDLGIWTMWTSNLVNRIFGVGVSSINQIFGTSRINTSGKIYRMNPSADSEVYTDDGAAYTMTIRTSRLDFGTNNRTFINEVGLIGDKEAAGTATLEYSTDDFATWTSLGTFDMTQMQNKICAAHSCLGAIAYRITHSAAYPFRAEALEFTYTKATI